jgi:pyrimidine-specific ribonucleoside hydrolase
VSGRNIFLDVDTGVDDALALLLAVRSPQLNVKGVTCVAGNVPIDKVVRNTLDILNVADASHVPVATGMEFPLVERMFNATEIHGANGLGGIDLPASPSTVIDKHAVEFLAEEIDKSSEKVTIVALGPLTNIATLFRIYPNVVSSIEQLVIMGGAIGPGNITPTAEFNIRQDPEAADMVFNTDVPTLLYVWDVFTRVIFDKQEVEEMIVSDNKCKSTAGKLLLSYLNTKKEDTAGIGDAGAVACLLIPEAITIDDVPISVELTGEHTRGQTVFDQRKRSLSSLQPKIQKSLSGMTEVVVDLDVESFRNTFVDNIVK